MCDSFAVNSIINSNKLGNLASEANQSLVLKATSVATGEIIKTQFINATKGSNQVAVTLDNYTDKGIYIITLEGDGIKYNPAKLMVNKK